MIFASGGLGAEQLAGSRFSLASRVFPPSNSFSLQSTYLVMPPNSLYNHVATCPALRRFRLAGCRTLSGTSSSPSSPLPRCNCFSSGFAELASLPVIADANQGGEHQPDGVFLVREMGDDLQVLRRSLDERAARSSWWCAP